MIDGNIHISIYSLLWKCVSLAGEYSCDSKEPALLGLPAVPQANFTIGELGNPTSSAERKEKFIKNKNYNTIMQTLSIMCFNRAPK